MLSLKGLIGNKKGISTVEVVIIIAVLVVVALIFKEKLIDFVEALFSKVLDAEKIGNQLGK